MIEKPHLSPSQLNMFMRCPKQYEFAYVQKIRRAPGIAQLRGRGIHQGAQTNFTQKVDSHEDLPRDDIVDASVAAFETELKGGYELSREEQSVGGGKVIGEAKDTVVSLAGLYADKVAPEYQPELVEQKVRIPFKAASHDLLGILDLADDQGRIVDLKSSSKSEQQANADSSLQLTTYAAAYRVHTGKEHSEIRLERLVDTKVPKRQTLVTSRDADDFQVLANTINAVLHAIKTGSFTPNTGGWWCSPRWCGYYSQCEFVNSKRVYSIGE